MNDFIRREDVFKAIVGLTTYKTVDDIEVLCEASVADSEGWLGGIRDALREVEHIPSAEIERKGEWISHENYDECSKCHCFTSVGFNYCPHCGAEMINEDFYMKLEGAEHE